MLENLLQEAAQAKNAGDYKQAAQIYEQAAKLCQNEPSQAENLALCLQELAEIYEQESLYDRLITVYKRMIVLGSKILGENHPDVINTAVYLARALEANKQFAQADEIYKLSAGRAEIALGLAHPLAQEIRDEYFSVLSNREGVKDDSLKLGLVPMPAAKAEPMTEPPKKIEPTTTHEILPSSIAIQSITYPPNNPTVKKGHPLPVKKPASLRQPKKIKNLRYGAEGAEQEASNFLNIHVLRHRWRTVFYIGSVIVCLAAITIALSRLLVPTHISAADLIGEQLIVKGSFQSVDGNSGVHFIDNRYVMLSSDVQHRKIPYFLLKGSMADLWAIALSTVVTKENWYQFKGDELINEYGNVLYADGAPEFVVAKKMQIFAQAASRYYTTHGCYPDKNEKLSAEPGIIYINPFNSKTELPFIKRINGSFNRDTIFPGVKPDAGIQDCFAFLRRGGTWREDPSIGRISALALYSSQRCADGYKVNEFYIHGYDRNSHLLTSGKQGVYYIFGFSSGKSLTSDSDEHIEQIEQASVHAPKRIYVVPGDSTDLQFMHQLGTNLLTAIAFLIGIAWAVFGLYPRLKTGEMKVYPIDIIFVFALFVWAISFFIHLMG